MVKKHKWIHLGNTTKPIGYCFYHKTVLSAQQLKSKECIEKGCKRLLKYDCAFWDSFNKKKSDISEHKLAKEKTIAESSSYGYLINGDILSLFKYYLFLMTRDYDKMFNLDFNSYDTWVNLVGTPIWNNCFQLLCEDYGSLDKLKNYFISMDTKQAKKFNRMLLDKVKDYHIVTEF